MSDPSINPLDQLEEIALYKLLGDAWYAQCRPDKNESYFLASSTEVGKREFGAVLPILRAILAQPHPQGVVACVATTIRQFGQWSMPANVVAALAVKQGLERSLVSRQRLAAEAE